VTAVKDLRACYEARASENPDLKGTLVVRWEIDPAGNATRVSLVRSTLNDEAVHECVFGVIRTLQFPAAASSTVVEGYPFKFGVGR